MMFLGGNMKRKLLDSTFSMVVMLIILAAMAIDSL